jgi:hypothetical protein
MMARRTGRPMRRAGDSCPDVEAESEPLAEIYRKNKGLLKPNATMRQDCSGGPRGPGCIRSIADRTATSRYPFSLKRTGSTCPTGGQRPVG